MSLRLWRKVRSCPHPSGVSYRRQQPWLNLSLTRRQRRFFRPSKVQYSGLLGRSVTKTQLLRVLNRGSNQISTKGFVPLTTGQATKVATAVAALSHTNQRGTLKLSLPAMRSQLAKILWFFKSPSAIPGLVKVDRIRSLYRRQRQNRRRLNLWLGRVQMRMLLKLSEKCHVSGLSSSVWSWVQALEAHWPLLVTKVGWSANVPQARQVVLHQQLQRNGQEVHKIWSVAHPADVVTLKNQHAWANQMSHLLAAKHSLMVQCSLDRLIVAKPRISRFAKKKYNKYKSFFNSVCF